MPGSADGSPIPQGSAIYLDYNATTPVDPVVREAMLPYLGPLFGNPSSSHAFGGPARAALWQARERVAGLIGADGGRIVFTGSGSEADHLAIRGAVLAARRPGRRPHVITQATEHPAVLSACRDLEQLHGVAVTVLPVAADGRVAVDRVAESITGDTLLISLMHANNETGTLQPVPEVASVAHERGVLVHCDAAQTAGRIPLSVAGLGADLITVVGHKMYGPKGVAALYVGPGVAVRPLVSGGGQEEGLRAGTENVASIVGLGRAALLAQDALCNGEAQRVASLRDSLHRALSAGLGRRLRLNGHPVHRLPNTLNVSLLGVRAQDLLGQLDMVAASTGSACHSGGDQPSAVLSAMGVRPADAMSAVRLSLGRWTTKQDVEAAAREILRAAAVV